MRTSVLCCCALSACLLTMNPALADPMVFGADATTVEGVAGTLQSHEVRFRVRTQPGGWGHFETEIKVSLWKGGAQLKAQDLYLGQGDGEAGKYRFETRPGLLLMTPPVAGTVEGTPKAGILLWTFAPETLTFHQEAGMPKPPKLESLYTALHEKGEQCTFRMESDPGMVSTETRCKGPGGYEIAIVAASGREALVVYQGAKKIPVRPLSAAFGGLGKKVEWRVETTDGQPSPKAMILRTYVDHDGVKAQYLGVVRLGEKVCYVKKINVGTTIDAHAVAREIANFAPYLPCR